MGGAGGTAGTGGGGDAEGAGGGGGYSGNGSPGFITGVPQYNAPGGLGFPVLTGGQNGVGSGGYGGGGSGENGGGGGGGYSGGGGGSGLGGGGSYENGLLGTNPTLFTGNTGNGFVTINLVTPEPATFVLVALALLDIPALLPKRGARDARVGIAPQFPNRPRCSKVLTPSVGPDEVVAASCPSLRLQTK